MDIQFLQRAEIDTTKWNACVQRSSNGLLYSYAYYLDCVCSQWDGLVLGDYEAVMPLPWRHKWGVFYLYQPYLAAQLGVTADHITPQTMQHFLNAIPKKFRFWDLALNHGNVYSVPDYPFQLRSNYTLDLQLGYEKIFADYRLNTRRNRSKALVQNCTVEKNLSIETAIDLVKKYTPVSRGQHFPVYRFQQLFSILKQQGKAMAYGVISPNKQLLSTAIFMWSNGRVYYLLAANHAQGKQWGTSYQLIDAFIEQHAGQHLLLDFEGSDHAGLAFFYSGFGAIEEKYSALQINRLPSWVKWLKK
ncbi:MAG: hypothetical protein WKF70_03860 [Chitinophagaceae bacterium]